MTIVIKRAKRDWKRNMLFGKKYTCFGCGIRTHALSRVICFKEAGVMGLFYSNGILCKDCSSRVRKKMCEILIQKAHRKSENSVYN